MKCVILFVNIGVMSKGNQLKEMFKELANW